MLSVEPEFAGETFGSLASSAIAHPSARGGATSFASGIPPQAPSNMQLAECALSVVNFPSVCALAQRAT